MQIILISEKNSNITIEVMFAGINMFWARLRLILARAARPARAQNIFMPKNIDSITTNITLEGTEEIKTDKMTTKHSEYIFHQRCEKTPANFEMASRF